MPRCARVKTLDSVFHVMVRSVGDIPLFKNDDDKDYYLEKVKKYKETFLFKIYAYCLMDTHAHFIIDSNGADISRFMHVINQCYAQYYNKVHKRHGHLFGDRFKSIIVEDDAYIITLSGYIHKNASDLKNYKGRVEEYPYSTLGIYLGINKDEFKMVDVDFIMGCFGKDVHKARIAYSSFVDKCIDPKMKEIVEFKNEKSEYRSERTLLVRDYDPVKIAEFVAKYTGNNPEGLHVKNTRRNKDFKALSILLMRSLCNYSYKDICALAGNLTISQASRLSMFGYEISQNDERYKNIISNFISQYKRNIS